MIQASQVVRDALWGMNVLQVRDLITLYLPQGTQRWTTSVSPVTIGSTTWSSNAPVITLPYGTSDFGLAVDARNVDLLGEYSIGGQTLPQLALLSAFDDVRFVWQEAYVVPGGTIVGPVSRFDGIVTDASPVSGGVRLRVRSGIALLDRDLPARSFGLQCGWAFGSADCGHVRQPGETCDHTIAACKAYGNLTRFGGFPYMPKSEAG